MKKLVNDQETTALKREQWDEQGQKSRGASAPAALKKKAPVTITKAIARERRALKVPSTKIGTQNINRCDESHEPISCSTAVVHIQRLYKSCGLATDDYEVARKVRKKSSASQLWGEDVRITTEVKGREEGLREGKGAPIYRTMTRRNVFSSFRQVLSIERECGISKNNEQDPRYWTRPSKKRRKDTYRIVHCESCGRSSSKYRLLSRFSNFEKSVFRKSKLYRRVTVDNIFDFQAHSMEEKTENIEENYYEDLQENNHTVSCWRTMLELAPFSIEGQQSLFGPTLTNSLPRNKNLPLQV
ncbi:unnamed protein product [Nesidiocoris tenuis]|uniref:Uncharacterized protein n=1 Tax=Nesidiocoris tenuis TaxID=355587 RepID=A0A6H5FXN8_9HEMI|nr:unnamed protein product [Nesidiocoris tenuis]